MLFCALFSSTVCFVYFCLFFCLSSIGVYICLFLVISLLLASGLKFDLSFVFLLLLLQWLDSVLHLQCDASRYSSLPAFYRQRMAEECAASRQPRPDNYAVTASSNSRVYIVCVHVSFFSLEAAMCVVWCPGPQDNCPHSGLTGQQLLLFVVGMTRWKWEELSGGFF